MVEAWRCMCMFMSSLFKYFPAEYIKDKNGKERNYALESIKNNTLWASIPDAFNDPFECESRCTIDDLMKAAMQKDWKVAALDNPTDRQSIENELLSIITAAREQLKSQIGITCFSRKDTSLLMWGHYANCHRGICVEYDASKFTKKMWPVEYHSEMICLTGYKGIKLQLAVIGSLYRKSPEWSYEEEVRAIHMQVPLGEQGASWDAPIPKSIRLGVKADESLKAEIKDLCKEKGIELYQMKKVPGQYAIEKIKIDL